jgi:hypothetical protein
LNDLGFPLLRLDFFGHDARPFSVSFHQDSHFGR